MSRHSTGDRTGEDKQKERQCELTIYPSSADAQFSAPDQAETLADESKWPEATSVGSS
jgi:hypothetical protein